MFVTAKSTADDTVFEAWILTDDVLKVKGCIPDIEFLVVESTNFPADVTE